MGDGPASRILAGRLGGLWLGLLAVVLLPLSARAGFAESAVAGKAAPELFGREVASHYETGVRDTAAAGRETAPGKPTDLTATAIDTSQIGLVWRPPADSGSSAVVAYQVEASGDGFTWNIIGAAVAPDTTYTQAGLTPNTTYYYRVKAVNSTGPGEPSDTASATTEGTGVPGAPTGLTATADGHSAIDLSWAAPADTGTSAIAGYRIDRLSDDFLSWVVLVANTDTTATTYKETGLDPGTTRIYRVAAINAVGAGPESDPADATTETGAPGPPTSLTAAAAGDTAIDLSWDAPADTGSSPINSYRIEWLDGSGFSSSWKELEDSTHTTATTYKHTGLDPGTERTYRVSARNGSGLGDPSGTATATTASPPGKPTNLTATADGDTAIDLEWDAPADTGSSAITGYRIEVSEDGTNWTDLVDDTKSTDTTYVHSGLQAGNTRHYRVSAINGSGTGDPSGTATATTESPSDPRVPGKPANLTAEAAGTSVIHLAWEEPADTGGSAIDGYRIEVSRDEGANWTHVEENTGSTATSYTYSGLRPGSRRHFRVFAINDSGRGEPSDVAHATTAAGRVPDPPTGLTAQADGQTAIDLTWDAPADTGTSSILGYRVEVSEDEGASWADLTANTGSAETAYRHTGLQPSAVRHYRVSAINGSGTGLPSDVAGAATEDPRPPGAPTDLTAVADGQSVINLEWTAPADSGNSAITGYRIEVSASGSNWTDLRANTNSTATGSRQSGLPPASRRHYRVSAINAIGTGMPSDVATARTDAAVPGAPTGLAATAVGQTQIDLSWEAPANDGGSPVTGPPLSLTKAKKGSWRSTSEQNFAKLR